MASEASTAAARAGDDVRELVRQVRRRERRRVAVIRACQVLTVVVVLLLWQSATSQRDVLGSPSEAGRVLWRWLGDGAFRHQLGVTLREAVLGYAIGSVAGVAIAFSVYPSRLLRRAVMPLLAALNALPKVALAPLLLMLLGLGSASKTGFVVSTVLFIALWNTLNGLRAIDPIYVRNARVLGASRLQVLTNVYLPATVGWLGTALRLGWSWALGGAVFAEYLGALEGLGTVITRAQATLDQSQVVAALAVIAILAVAGDRLLARAETRMSRWRIS